MSDGWPPIPAEADGRSWEEVKRYVNIRLFAELFMGDELEWARILGTDAPGHDEVWARAEGFYERTS